MNKPTKNWANKQVRRNTYILILLFTNHHVLRFVINTILCIWSPLILRVNYERWLVLNLNCQDLIIFWQRPRSNIRLSNKQKIPETWSHSLFFQFIHLFIQPHSRNMYWSLLWLYNHNIQFIAIKNLINSIPKTQTKVQFQSQNKLEINTMKMLQK